MSEAATVRLALGTAQFGLGYGVTHQGGPVPDPEVGRILAQALSGGLDLLDTAAAYGDSEAVLGRHEAAVTFRIATKILPLRVPRIGAADIQNVQQGFARSLSRLRCATVDVLMVHHADDLLVPGADALWEALVAERSAGRVKRLGVSVYDGATALRVAQAFPVEVVQLPLNALDQRSILDGSLAQLHARGVEVQARSLFLQGLLLDHSRLPVPSPAAVDAFRRWDASCREAGVAPIEAALGFVRSRPEIAHAVVGVQSLPQLQALLAAFARETALDWPELACDDETVLDPRLWPMSG